MGEREMSDEFTKEQLELLKKPLITIMPAFNDEWVMETCDADGRLTGRFNAIDADTVVAAVRAALTEVDGPPRFDVN